MNLRILHKGLLILLLPLVLQVFFFGLLGHLLQTGEELALQETRFNESMDLANEVAAKAGYGWYFVGTMMIKPASAQDFDPESFKRDIDVLLQRADTHPADSSANLILSDARDFLYKEYRLLKDLKVTANSESFIDRLQTFKRLEGPTSSLFSDMLMFERLKHDEMASIVKARERIRTNRARIENSIKVGVIADVILTLALLVFFLTDISKRLAELVENAKLIPSGKPLVNRVRGSDELAYLDKALRNASMELQSAAEHRKSLTEMLAHDLRAPLMSASLALDSLKVPEVRESPEVHDAQADSIKRNLRRLVSLVEDLLTVDKLESGKLDLELEEFDMHSAVQEACEDLSAHASNRKISLQNQVAEPLNVVADRRRITQLLTNLISNGIKYSVPETPVTVSAEKSGSAITVSIQDSGPGISKEEQEQLFQKFYQVGSVQTGEGFGLGLAICKLIIERHKGKLGVESQKHHGSRFWFSLPVDADDD